MGDESSCKVYVSTAAEFSADGFLRPLWIIWEDGRRFDIDRVVHVERAASRKAGGVGLRYTVMIGGKRHHLYVRGKVILQPQGKEFFTCRGKNFFTSCGKEFFT